MITPTEPAELADFIGLDKDRIGTMEYQGYAWFWNHYYRHQMRMATRQQRRLVHKRLCQSNLEVDGISQDHQYIINSIVGI